jgi:acetyl-CoA synthetase
MNLGGIKVSANQIEGVLAQLDFVQESAAIAISPVGGGPSSLVIYLVPDPNNQLKKKEILQIMQQTVRQSLNPLFKISDCCLVEGLPRTASNKVMRRKLRQDYLA